MEETENNFCQLVADSFHVLEFTDDESADILFLTSETLQALPPTERFIRSAKTYASIIRNAPLFISTLADRTEYPPRAIGTENLGPPGGTLVSTGFNALLPKIARYASKNPRGLNFFLPAFLRYYKLESCIGAIKDIRQFLALFDSIKSAHHINILFYLGAFLGEHPEMDKLPKDIEYSFANGDFPDSPLKLVDIINLYYGRKDTTIDSILPKDFANLIYDRYIKDNRGFQAALSLRDKSDILCKSKK